MNVLSMITAFMGIVAACNSSLCWASDSPRDNIRVDVNLVRVPLVAIREGSKPLRDVTREELRVSDDGIPQDIKYLWRETDLPLTIAFLIDIGELEGKKTSEKFKVVVREFIGTAIGPEDSGLLATLDTQARIVSDAGSSKEQLLRAIDQIQYEGNAGTPIGEPCQPPPSPPLRRPGTDCVGRPLWDAIFHIARSKLTGTQEHKAIVVFTDGYDLGSSVHGLSSAIEAAESAGITVYTVRYEGRCAPTDRERRLVPVLGDRGMQEIAEATGGRAFKQPRRFDAVYRQIEEDLRSQYVLAYTPGNPAAHGTWHRLNVQITRPRAQTRAPARYRVP
jgi:VWFA-related protein